MRFLYCALLGTVLACGSPTEPSAPFLHFEADVVFGIPTIPITAKPQAGGIIISGVFQTPTSGYTLSGALVVLGARLLRLEVDAHGTDPAAPFPTQNFYRAQVGDLEPGDYDVSVYHKDRNRPEVPSVRVYRQTVRVP
jgi:hypothetical protein